MATLNEAAVESIELEQVGKEIAMTWPTFRGLYNLFEKSAKKVNIANVTQAAGQTRSAWRETLITQGASGIWLAPAMARRWVRAPARRPQPLPWPPSGRST